MRALICDEYTGIDNLRFGELPDPTPKPGSALIEVEAAAVGFADSLVVAGLYQMRPDLPFAPGSEAAGTVLATGGIDGIAPGDRVCGFVGFGGLAERALMPANAIVRLPESISFDTGAAIPVSYGTSYHALVDRARLEAGEDLLVLGASGGVGLAAVQIGKALGANVIAAVSSAAKAEAVRDAGADHVIRYDEVPLRDGIAEVTNGAGVDVVYDPVGGESTEHALRSTKWNGRLLVVGFAAGQIPSIPINLTLVKGNAIIGVFWGRHYMEQPDENERNFRQIMTWVEDGTLSPLIQKVFPLEDGAEAIRWVAERKAIGRVVVKP
ncbi:MAG: NADPH:quinone oxidoreductase family protein [Acidimicrobiia bacterium]|nr:NADPH:quinone oxidoreductase family protein [Acidimicrobiia bacterium]